MEKDTVKTKVFFVKCVDEFEGVIVAVMPEDIADMQGNPTCYAHIGQHSACSKEWYLEQKMAKPKEYADLLRELEDRGYNFTILTKMPK